MPKHYNGFGMKRIRGEKLVLDNGFGIRRLRSKEIRSFLNPS